MELTSPKILILYKNTAYQRLLSENTREDIIPDRFRRTHQQHLKTLSFVESVLKKHGLKFKIIARGRKLDYRPFDLVITVGGDGTFLEAAKNMTSQLILGVNSAPGWSVGRFCIAAKKNFEQVFEQMIKGKIAIRSLERMSVTLPKTGRKVEVLNDILICHKNPAAMSHYLIKTAAAKEEHRSSGIWISTAAGSTGGIHSAGGKVQRLTDKRLQYRVRELYFGSGAHSCLNAGYISPDDKIRISSLMQDGVVFVDGSHDRIPLPFGTEVVVSTSAQPLRVVGL